MNYVIQQILPIAGPWLVFGAVCLWLMRPDHRRSKAMPDGRTALREEIEALAAINEALVTRLKENQSSQNPAATKAASTSRYCRERICQDCD